MIQKNLKGLERMEVLITYVKVFLAINVIATYVLNAKVTSIRKVYGKTGIKRKVFKGVFRTHSNIYD